MAAVIENSPGITVAVTSTSPELNINKKIDTSVIDSSGNNENKMTTKQHHNDEGECK
jgi:hypothetical protein